MNQWCLIFNFFVGLIAAIILPEIAFSEPMVRCFVDVDRHCKQPQSLPNYRPLLGGLDPWPQLRLFKRDTLYLSRDVQGSADGCAAYARLIKTECLLPQPIVSFFYREDGELEKMAVAVNYEPTMKQNMGSYGQDFQSYFANCDQNGTQNLHYDSGQCIPNGLHLENGKQTLDYQLCEKSDKNAVLSAYYWDPIHKGYGWSEAKKAFNKKCQALVCRNGWELMRAPGGRLFCAYRFKFSRTFVQMKNFPEGPKRIVDGHAYKDPADPNKEMKYSPHQAHCGGVSPDIINSKYPAARCKGMTSFSLVDKELKACRETNHCQVNGQDKTLEEIEWRGFSVPFKTYKLKSKEFKRLVCRYKQSRKPKVVLACTKKYEN